MAEFQQIALQHGVAVEHLLPGIGDALSTVLSSYIIWEARRLGLPVLQLDDFYRDGEDPAQGVIEGASLSKAA